MKLIAVLVAALSFQITHGRRRLRTDAVRAAFTPEECVSLIADVSAFDADASGGLSSDEYFEYLSSLGLTALATSYAELDYFAKVSFATMACSCASLGLGDDCCSGEDAEIQLSFPSTVDDSVANAYVANLCSVLLVEESAPPPTVAPTTTISPPAVGASESPMAVDVTELPVAGTTSPPVAVNSTISTPTAAVFPPDNIPPVMEDPAEPENTSASGAAIVFIVLAVVFVPLAIIYFFRRYRRTKDKELIERFRQFEASQASRVVKAGDDEDDPAVSSLAAMGAAGIAATMLDKGSAK